jgi:hypothetical protein
MFNSMVMLVSRPDPSSVTTAPPVAQPTHPGPAGWPIGAAEHPFDDDDDEEL